MGKPTITNKNLLIVDEMGHDVNGDGEDDGAVVFC